MIKSFEEFINESKLNEGFDEGVDIEITDPFAIDGYENFYCALSEEDENMVFIFVEDVDKPVVSYSGLEWPESTSTSYEDGGKFNSENIYYFPSRFKNDRKFKSIVEDDPEFLNAIFRTFVDNEVLENE